MVKPNILTHVIEGYVIQEAGEPFAVCFKLFDLYYWLFDWFYVSDKCKYLNNMCN